MNPLETYLTELREIHDSGAATGETSGYPALANLLNAIGHSLKPKVRCIIQLKNSGVGLPDGGLFTPDQLKPATAKSCSPTTAISCCSSADPAARPKPSNPSASLRA